MKFNVDWLKQWINTDKSAAVIAEDLTSIGLEVESCDDNVIDINVPSNRGDCLSILGIARDLSAKYNTNIKKKYKDNQNNIVNINSSKDTVNFKVFIDPKVKHLCPKYIGRFVTNIDNNQNIQTPEWIKKILIDSGIKNISPIVDIVNFVMLELGQPMHVFDLDKLDQKIIVRQALNQEKIVLLDNKEVSLDSNDLVITDNNSVLALAGIMGGLDSSVTGNTKNILLECAYFDPIGIRKTSQKYKIQSDSSYRFERGVDPEIQIIAINRACELLQEIVGGEFSDLIIAGENINPDNNVYNSNKKITLNKKNITRLLGVDLENNIILDILTRLGIKTESNNIQHENKNDIIWELTIPSYRHDLDLEVDIIEEIIRVYGLDNIPSIMPTVELKFKLNKEENTDTFCYKQCLQARSYNEVITYGFMGEDKAKLFLDNIDKLKLVNPISSELSCMRPSLWPNLLDVIKVNQHRSEYKVKIFEIGNKFIPDDQDKHKINEVLVLAGACSGELSDCKWNKSGKSDLSFYNIKSDIEAILALSNKVDINYELLLDNSMFNNINNKILHPGQSAQILYEKEHIGFIGRLHPRLELQMDLKGPIFLFEIEIQKIENSQLSKFSKLSKFPKVNRDFSFIVGEDVKFAQLANKIKQYLPGILNSIEIFDIYIGEGLPKQTKSMSVSISLQDNNKTLVDEEVNQKIESMLELLSMNDKIVLR